MRNNTKISGLQTSLFGEDASMSSPEDFPASPSVLPANEKEPTTTVISGRRCCEQFGRLHPAMSWARMFSESLVGRTDWFSSRCALIWKLKGSKCSRMYFQLAASTRRTRDTAPGSSLMLLKTPSAIDAYADRLNKKEQRFGNSGSLAQEAVSGFIYRRGLLPTVQTQGLKVCENGKSAPVPLGLLPTPTVSDGQGGIQKVTGRTVMRTSGQIFSVCLRDLAGNGLLPTPRASKITGGDRADFSPSLPGLLRRNMLPTPKANDFRSGMQNRVGTTHMQQLNDTVAYRAGKTSRLNPLFVEEMMGFPTCWILTPFLRDYQRSAANTGTLPSAGELSRSSAMETPSCRR